MIAPTSSDTAAAQSRTVPLQEDPLGQTASTASISGFGYARRQRKDGEDQADCVEVDESSVWRGMAGFHSILVVKLNPDA